MLLTIEDPVVGGPTVCLQYLPLGAPPAVAWSFCHLPLVSRWQTSDLILESVIDALYLVAMQSSVDGRDNWFKLSF